MVDVDACVLSHLKDGLSWAGDKWLWFISTMMIFKNSYRNKELKGTERFRFKQYCIHCYVALGNVF